MNFRAKIWMLPLCAAAVFVVGTTTSQLVGERTSQALETLRSTEYPYQELVAKIDRVVDEFRVTLQSAAGEGDTAKLDDAGNTAAAALAHLDELARVQGKSAVAEELRKSFETYREAGIEATRGMLNGNPGNALTEMQSAKAALDQQLAAHKEQAAAAVAAAQDAAAGGVRRGLWVGLISGLITLIALGLASRLIVRSVWRDLGDEPARLREAVQRIADGDLAPSTLASGAHQGSLGAAVMAMAVQLRQTVGLIHKASDSIATASSQIATGNQDLNNRTEQAANSLQSTAASMEELTSAVNQSADAARQANQLASSAAKAAEQGGSIVDEVVGSMEAINEASQRINDIIGVIDTIAFQTNILALNAAVEAARAGEQGRGFAVVAGEVRSLAQRSAEAAREIKVLIATSGERVNGGVRLAKDAGTAMRDIVAGVKRVSDIMADISTATFEQSKGINNINDSIGVLDRMTQENAALVGESAAAAESLREQALRLSQAVAAFRLAESAAAQAMASLHSAAHAVVASHEERFEAAA